MLELANISEQIFNRYILCKINIIIFILFLEEMLILYMCSPKDVDLHRRDWNFP